MAYKIWYRVADKKVTPHRVLRITNTLVYYLCRFTGEQVSEYLRCKKNSWFETEAAANAHLKAEYMEEINEVNKEIETLKRKLKTLEDGLKEAEVLEF